MVGHIYIYGEIENYQGDNANEHGVCSLKSVVNSYNNQSEATEFVVHIHSNGGDVHEGLAIYDFLKSSGKNITTRVDGMCASIASVILLAGTFREATENSNVFIHNAWTMAVGDANELEETSKGLRKYTDIIKAIYLKETNLSSENITYLMDNETSFTLDECLENGFVNKKVNQLKAVAKLNIKNNMDLKAISKTLKEALTGKESQPIKNVLLTLVDGTSIDSSSEDATPAVGDVLKLEGGEAVPDAVHELQSGYNVTTEGGIITEVEKIEEIESTEESTEEVVEDSIVLENKALKAELETLKNSISNSSKEVEVLKASNKETLDTLKEAMTVVNKLRNSTSKEINTSKEEDKPRIGITSRVKKENL